MLKLVMSTQTADIFDIEAVLQMGLSAKTEGAIGRFGSGLKYAIAQTMARDAKFYIVTPDTEFRFLTKDKTFRGTDYKQVYWKEWGVDNPVPCGFTTHLGFEWEPWMLARELLCNTRDEGGTWRFTEEDTFTPKPGELLVICTAPDIVEAARTGNIFITEGLTRLAGSSSVEIYDAPSPFVYYRGVRVAASPQHPLPLTLNYLGEAGSINLREDRTSSVADVALRASDILESSFTLDLATAETIVLRIADLTDEQLESSGFFGFLSVYLPSDAFIEALENAEPRIAADRLHSILRKARLARSGREFDSEPPTDEQWAKIRRTHAAIELLGYDPVGRSRIFIMDRHPDGLGACYSKARGHIYIAKSAFHVPEWAFTAMMIEETIHARTGQPDYSRMFQTTLLCHVVQGLGWPEANAEAMFAAFFPSKKLTP